MIFRISQSMRKATQSCPLFLSSSCSNLKTKQKKPLSFRGVRKGRRGPRAQGSHGRGQAGGANQAGPTSRGEKGPQVRRPCGVLAPAKKDVLGL